MWGDGDAERFVALCRRDAAGGGVVHMAVMHVAAEERADKLRALVEAELAPASLFTGPFGAGMVAHTGPGLLGLAWWWEVS